MKEIVLHMLDIVENAAKAGARQVELGLRRQGTRLGLRIADDGPGLAPELGPDPTDPFRTTRRDRKVGLGLGLLRAAAEVTGGWLVIGPGAAGGVVVEAEFDLAHVDARPLGPLAETLVAVLVAWPALELVVRLEPGGGDVLDTGALRQELDDVPLTHPEVRQLLARRLAEELAEFQAWADDTFAGALSGLATETEMGTENGSAGQPERRPPA